MLNQYARISSEGSGSYAESVFMLSDDFDFVQNYKLKS